MDPAGGDIEIIPVIESCYSHYQHIWLGVIFAFKGMLLVKVLFIFIDKFSQRFVIHDNYLKCEFLQAKGLNGNQISFLHDIIKCEKN